VIRLQNLSKTYMVNGVPTEIADDITVTFPTGSSVALMGRNGAGKSSLLKIISGVMRPTSGEVISDGTISWNVGFAGSFHPDLTGAQNVRFVARIYGVDTDALQAFVAEFAELGHHFQQPFRTYSAGMRARLAFGVSMGIRFDTYLIDEVTSVGDAAFRQRSEQILRARLEESSAIVVSHSVGLLREICTSGAVLEAGKLRYFDDVEDAIEAHNRNMTARVPA
jgi:capsular polysaccharide transport system ATP-binding protein